MYSEKPLLHERQRNHRAGSLRTVALDVTPLCNMKCEKCYAETFAKAAPVPLDVLGGALDELYGMGVFHYVMQGGEAISDPTRLEAILRMCHPDASYINVVTNGWGMTREKIRWLRSLKVDKIAFSLDSGLESEHDQLRCPGSFRRVLQAIDDTQSEGLLASISVVVTHQSLHSEGFRMAYQIAADRKIRIDTQIAEPVGKWDGNTEVLMTTEDSRHLKKLQQDAPILPNGQRMVNRDIYTGSSDHCPAGVEFMGISADGNVLPCNFLQFTLGNIRDGSIALMREALIASRWFDGSHPVCICGEDREFFTEFIRPYVGLPKPLDAYKIFGLSRGDTK